MIISGQFNDSLTPIVDGVAITAQNYAYWLNRHHAPAFVIGPKVPGYTDNDPNYLRYRSLKLQRSGPYRLGMPRMDLAFSNRIASIPFDLVHAHCPFVSGHYALELARKRKIPLVATFHSKYREDFAKFLPFEAPLDQTIAQVIKFYEKADAVWVPNEAIIDTLREYGYHGPVDHVPNGSDITFGDAAERQRLRKEGRASLEVPVSVPLLLYVGQHRRLKNIHLILDALTILDREGLDFRMCFVGEGEDRKTFNKIVTERHLEAKIRFAGPVFDRERLKRFYAAADLFLFPSLYDNASLATREAAGFGVPTLFIEGATTAHGIIDGVNGFLSMNAPSPYAAKIRAVCSNAHARQQAGNGAAQFLYIPWEKIASIVYEKYEEIVERYHGEQSLAI